MNYVVNIDVECNVLRVNADGSFSRMITVAGLRGNAETDVAPSVGSLMAIYADADNQVRLESFHDNALPGKGIVVFVLKTGTDVNASTPNLHSYLYVEDATLYRKHVATLAGPLHFRLLYGESLDE